VSLKDVFRSRIERAAQILEEPATGPKTIRFGSVDLSSPEKLEQLHERFPGKGKGVIYLYQLSIDNTEQKPTSPVRTAFRQAQANKKCNMSRDNTGHSDSCSLYVGTSKTLYERFRTHLGRGTGKTTWALYLSEWGSQLDTKFIVEYYEFTETTSEDVELIEGVLWDSLRPLFGKKGGR
jgi:hypothetical protein